LSPRQFSKLITALRREGADPVRKGRQWSLPLEDRVLLVAAYWRTHASNAMGNFCFEVTLGYRRLELLPRAEGKGRRNG
jgi:hypothetical protein